jgi:hypothetical protein
MKDYTESKALQIVSASGARVDSKVVIVEEGLSGLKACGALDFLVNKCGYKSSMRIKTEDSKKKSERRKQ